MTTGIIAALPQEIETVLELMGPAERPAHGGRVFTRGSIADEPVVVAHARIGKVAAAITACELIIRFDVSRILFTGVAGGLSPDVLPGDIVVADTLVQHDLDASPLFPPGEIPLTGVTELQTDPEMRASITSAARRFLDSATHIEAISAIARANQRGPRVHAGEIATGDRFIASARARREVLNRRPDALCVEMEGAAVAQVCRDYGVPFAAIRLISDAADDQAAHAFQSSLEELAGIYARGVLGGWLGAG